MPEDDEFMSAFVEAVRQLVLPDDSIMERAAPRWERRKCRDGKQGWFSYCKKCREGMPCQGPYLYLYVSL